MRKNKILEKLLAIVLIFTLTSTNFAFVTKTYATTLVESIFGSKSDTGHKNVSFEAFFEAEDDRVTSVISDVNNEELSIGTSIMVEKSGYLRDAKIEVAEVEEGKGLNFELKDYQDFESHVQGYEDNTIYLRQINCSSDEVLVNIPIEYVQEAYMNEEDLSKDLLVKFSGIYVDDDGDENEVSREVTLNVSWKDQREVQIETEATKYIDFGNGVILQTLVKVNNETEKNTLPVKETEVSIDVPTIDGKLPTNVDVVANTTFGTNGKTVSDVVFGTDNWSYNQEDNKLTINVKNEKELVKVDKYEDEYLQEMDKEVIEEERYFNGKGIDEYVVTYTFEDVTIEDEVVNVASNVNAKITSFSGVSYDENINIITKDDSNDLELAGEVGDIVSLNKETETKEVSKAYTYLNYENSNKNETEIKSETVVNISYKDIIENLIIEDINNVYVDKEGNEINNEDLYYKVISISKENFDNILGESGYIKIFDVDGNEVSSIYNNSEVNEEGNVVLNFNAKYSRLNIEISKPVSEGNLVLTNIKAMTNSSLDKAELVNVEKIVSRSDIKANYDYVEDITLVGTAVNEVAMKDTVTKADLIIDRDSLSTLSVNNDVEIRIALNNHTIESDAYGHSVFEFDLPEYVENFDITNSELLYAEGLSLAAVDVVGRTVRVELDGVQEGVNSGILTNGTNIVLNTNIKVNLFTPAKSEVVELRYVNDKATNYANDGISKCEVAYSAPTGLVTVNSTYNYNNVGSVLTSVRQGTQEDMIDIYTESKVATMELVVMNNNSNTVSNVSILGRIPFEGVKDIQTGEDLGTTKDTKLVSGLNADPRNNAEFNVYYSENGEATKDLDNENNGWMQNPESLDNIKSFLLVPQDSEYVMSESDTLRFTYDYEIPSNLPHNNELYGTFATYFTNNSEVAVTNEVSIPDMIGLSTGEGPDLSINVKLDKDSVKGYEEIRAKVEIKNIGKEPARDIVSRLELPKFASFQTVESDKEEISSEVFGNELIVTCSEIALDETISYTAVFVAKNMPTIEQYYKGTPGFTKTRDGSYVVRTYEVTEQESLEKGIPVSFTEEKIDSLPTVYIDTKATVTAKDLGTELSAVSNKSELKETEFIVTGYIVDEAVIDGIQDIGKEVELGCNVNNVSKSGKANTTVKLQLPYEFDFVSGELTDQAGRHISDASYDESSRTISWDAKTVDAGKYVKIRYKLKVARITEGTTGNEVAVVTTVSADGTSEYSSNTLNIKVGKAALIASQSTLTTNTYVKEGEAITYVFTVRNEGTARANRVHLEDKVPEGLIVRRISYTMNGLQTTKKVSAKDIASIDLTILPQTEAVITIEALASGLNGTQEKTVTNYATISAANTEEITTNSITHIIEAEEKTAAILDDTVATTDGSYRPSSSSTITKTYKVSGVAWVDEDRNGMRDSQEQLLSGITVRLVDSESGYITDTVTTDSIGSYMFSGVQSGNYLVIFDYDTVKYTATTFRQEGVASNVNSDAITTKISQDGRERNAAITDTISVIDGSVSNIDIGLVFAQTFDLSLAKTITKVTTQTSHNTDNAKFDNATIAKTEIKSKYLAGSTVYVQYDITVRNNGDIGGYAKKIVDYIPEGMTFNSSLEVNKGWYTGTDGNLYNDELANVEIVPGESKTLSLVLTKAMNEENTGIVNNLAEIYEDYNIYGISDKNSTPANKAQGENDLGSADMVIEVSTGEALVYVSVIITTVLLGSIVIFIAYEKIVVGRKRREGGV